MNKSSRILPVFTLETHLNHFTSEISLEYQLIWIIGALLWTSNILETFLYSVAKEKSLFLKKFLHEDSHFLKSINHTFAILNSSVRLCLHIPFQFLLLSPVIFPIHLFLPFPSNFLLSPDWILSDSFLLKMLLHFFLKTLLSKPFVIVITPA